MDTEQKQKHENSGGQTVERFSMSRSVREGWGWRGDAPCCSSRVMDPSCLFTTDEGESVTQMRPTKHRTQRSNHVHAHEG